MLQGKMSQPSTVPGHLQRDQLKDIGNKASEGSKTLFDLIAKGNGHLLLLLIKPQYNLMTDNTVNYVFEGKGGKGLF